MRTFRTVAKLWSKKHPEEKISAATAARIHDSALSKIRELLGEDESVDLQEDLIELLNDKDQK